MAGRAGRIYTFYQTKRQDELCRQLNKLGLGTDEIVSLKWSQIRHGCLITDERVQRLPRALWIELWKTGNCRHQQFPNAQFCDRDILMPYVLYRTIPSYSQSGIRYSEDDVQRACGKVGEDDGRKALTFFVDRANIRVSNEAH